MPLDLFIRDSVWVGQLGVSLEVREVVRDEVDSTESESRLSIRIGIGFGGGGCRLGGR